MNRIWIEYEANMKRLKQEGAAKESLGNSPFATSFKILLINTFSFWASKKNDPDKLISGSFFLILIY